MWKQKLCIGMIKGFEMEPKQQLQYIKNAGFDGFFAVWREPGQFDDLVKEASEIGLILQSIHAPFGKAREMWDPGEAGDMAEKELMDCLIDCKKLQAPIMVVHPYKGFDIEPPTEHGLARFGRIIEFAGEAGIKIAFENVEGEEHLALLFERFGHYDHVGFCWDSGHELCYNHAQDMLKKYGHKLFATHLNDNLGISREDGSIFWTDDLHLLPFDGIANWDGVAKRLDEHGFDGPLTFELSIASKTGRHDNDQYAQMPPEQYLALAYARACRVAAKRGIYGISSDN